MVQITPYQDITSEDILAAHISALQHNINKLETILDMTTTAKVGQTLNAVHDQSDQSMQYKIYEGVDRNWLTSPTPVIKRNGVIVNSSEYKIKPAQGAVIFTLKQNPSDVITSDYTMITAGSNLLATLATSIATNTTNIATNTGNVNTLLSKINAMPQIQQVGAYLSNAAVVGSIATGVAVGANNMDAFPFYVKQTSVFDTMRINLTTAAGTKMKLAIYGDNNYYPGNKLAETTEFDTTTTGVKEAAFSTGDLTLTPGLYWLARWQDGAISVDGLNQTSVIPLAWVPNGTTVDNSTSPSELLVGGIRVNITYDSIVRNPFPSIASGAKYLKRSTYGVPYVRRKS